MNRIAENKEKINKYLDAIADGCDVSTVKARLNNLSQENTINMPLEK